MRFHTIYNAVMRLVDQHADQETVDKVSAGLHEVLEKAMDDDEFYDLDALDYADDYADDWDYDDDFEDDFGYDD